jgi:hypothetical protein
MKPGRPASAFPTDLTVAAGIALALSNQWLVAIVACILWPILRRIKAGTPYTILLVTSLLLASAILGLINVATGMLSPLALIEMAAVSAAALLLFFTGAATWAYLLILHAGYIMVQNCISLRSPYLTPVLQRTLLGWIAQKALITWMLASYLRRGATALPDSQPDSQPNEDP